MKISISMALVALTISSTTFADHFTPHYPIITNTPAFYVRAEMGYQLINASPSSVINTTAFLAGQLSALIIADANKSEGFMGRLALGYGFRHFALEAGFALLNPSFRDYDGATYNANNVSATLNPEQTKTNLYSIDLLVKLLLPYESYYTFLGGGAAYVHQQFAALNTTLIYSAPGNAFSTPINLWPSNTNAYLCPKFIIGAGYSFSRHWALDASYYYLIGSGNVNNANFLPDLSAATLNLMYKF